MKEYSIFTEQDCNEEARMKNKSDLDTLEEKLEPLNIHKKQRSPNSIVVEYDGNMKEFMSIVNGAISQIERKSQMPIYKAPDADEMYSYK